MKSWNNLLISDNDKATILIRIVVGYIFIMEGTQKFVFTDSLGVGRFTKIGIPFPEFFAPFVGVTEIVCGMLFILGCIVRFSALPAIIIMTTALSTTKISILFEKGILTFSHEARNDLLMLFGCIFLLVKGGGAFSLDRMIKRK